MRRVLHGIWVVVKPLGAVVIALVLLLLAVLIPTLGGSAGTVKNNLNGVVPDVTATTGPLTGDQSAIPNEISCMKTFNADPANNRVNYPPAIGAAEHTDSIHTGVEPCVKFTGNFSGGPDGNQVYVYQSETTYDQNNLIVFNGPNDAFLLAGGTGPPSTGAYVVKFNPATGAQIWKTVLQNVNTSGQWLAFGSMAVDRFGDILVAAGPEIWKLDPDTGDILATETQPILGMPATDANFDGFHIAPDADGTILLKSQTRPVGCPTQGNFAMNSCQSQYGNQPDTTVIAADPDTLENIDAIKLPQSVTARPIVVAGPNGVTYMYMAGSTIGFRAIWDPATQKLSLDKSWQPKIVIEGQTGGTAPGLLGNWVINNANANGSSKTPICVTATSEKDANDIHRICPWGKTLPVNDASESETPASVGVDPDNSMIYAQDWLVGGVYGIHLDQKTGKMKEVWSRPDWRNSDYFSLIGPANQRVLISQYISPDFKMSQIPGYTWTETVEWANAKTGKTIARGPYGPSTALGSLPNVGYGGRNYMMGNGGSIFLYQVVPKKSSGGS